MHLSQMRDIRIGCVYTTQSNSFNYFFQLIQTKTRNNAIVEYLDYQIPVTQLMGPKGNGDMQAAKRD